MDERTKRSAATAAAKAGGITLFTAGGITIGKDAHILDHGMVRLDSLFHVETGGGASRVSVSNGGSAVKCERDWAIHPFASGQFNYLDDEKKPPGGGYSKDLTDAVHQAALSINRDAPHGDVLLLGSTDPVHGENVALAKDRADAVKALLEIEFGHSRAVTTVDDRIKYPNDKNQSDPKLNDGLARLLLGPGELGTRTVFTCVIDQQPHHVEVDGVGGAASGLAQGIALGIGIALMLLLAGWLFWRWAKRRPAPHAKQRWRSLLQRRRERK